VSFSASPGCSLRAACRSVPVRAASSKATRAIPTGRSGLSLGSSGLRFQRARPRPRSGPMGQGVPRAEDRLEDPPPEPALALDASCFLTCPSGRLTHRKLQQEGGGRRESNSPGRRPCKAGHLPPTPGTSVRFSRRPPNEPADLPIHGALPQTQKPQAQKPQTQKPQTQNPENPRNLKRGRGQSESMHCVHVHPIRRSPGQGRSVTTRIDRRAKSECDRGRSRSSHGSADDSLGCAWVACPGDLRSGPSDPRSRFGPCGPQNRPLSRSGASTAPNKSRAAARLNESDPGLLPGGDSNRAGRLTCHLG
jgi:hypothetical protein